MQPVYCKQLPLSADREVDAVTNPGYGFKFYLDMCIFAVYLLVRGHVSEQEY